MLTDDEVQRLTDFIAEGEVLLKQFKVAPLTPEVRKEYEAEIAEIEKKIRDARNVLLQDRVEKGL